MHGRARARGKGLPEGKFRISACGVSDGALGPLTVCCGDMSVTRAVDESDVKVALCVTHAARNVSRTKGLSCGSARDVYLLLSLIAIFERIWAALPLISGANHFESVDFPQ